MNRSSINKIKRIISMEMFCCSYKRLAVSDVEKDNVLSVCMNNRNKISRTMVSSSSKKKIQRHTKGKKSHLPNKTCTFKI